MLQTIHRQASLLINRVIELLDLARIEARQGKDLKRQPCRLNSLLTQATGPLVIEGGRRELRLDMQHPDRLFFVDPENLQRAPSNVLSNAAKYSPAGGVIQVGTVGGSTSPAPWTKARRRRSGC